MKIKYQVKPTTIKVGDVITEEELGSNRLSIWDDRDKVEYEPEPGGWDTNRTIDHIKIINNKLHGLVSGTLDLWVDLISLQNLRNENKL